MSANLENSTLGLVIDRLNVAPLSPWVKARQAFVRECIPLFDDPELGLITQITASFAACGQRGSGWLTLPRKFILTDTPFAEGIEALAKRLPQFKVGWTREGIQFFYEGFPFFPRCIRSNTRTPIPVALRAKVLAVGVCLFCGATEKLSVDHIKPVIRGGTNDESNLQCLCRSCNSRKHAKYEVPQ